mmetsp:Transcript_19681/g.24270  ORF Transcript_19681/g.24270 Transcript_19681/m.24270 type:complete len:428 (-) Transcript_19681:1208-2491(-)
MQFMNLQSTFLLLHSFQLFIRSTNVAALSQCNTFSRKLISTKFQQPTKLRCLPSHHYSNVSNSQEQKDGNDKEKARLYGNDNFDDDNEYHNDEDSKETKIRYRGRVAYDGTNFRGWQVQANGRTIQGDIEDVLSRRFNRKIKIVGAGRTDAGVHAKAQAFHFDIYPHECEIKKQTKNKLQCAETHDCNDDETQMGIKFCQQLQKSMNSMLQKDVQVWNICQSPLPATVTKILDDGKESIRTHKWHVIYQATKKLYVYKISMGPQLIATDPLQRYNRVHVDNSAGDNINVEYLQHLLKHYEGTHDFRAFAGAIEANQRREGVEHKNTIRTVYSVDLIDERGGNYKINILLQGALYKMVRNMVGTALDVCRGRMDEDYMLRMLHHNNKNHKEQGNSNMKKQFARKDNRCKPVPPQGLTLERVYFDCEDF